MSQWKRTKRPEQWSTEPAVQELKVIEHSLVGRDDSLAALSHGLAGLWTPEVLHIYLLALPVCLVALPVGGWLTGRLSKPRFERFSFFVLLCTGLLLVLR